MAKRRCWSTTSGWGESIGMVVGGLPVCGTLASWMCDSMKIGWFGFSEKHKRFKGE